MVVGQAGCVRVFAKRSTNSAPFQSLDECCRPSPDGSSADRETALDRGHETSLSWPFISHRLNTLETIDQVDPSYRMITVELPSPKYPTATQHGYDVQEMASGEGSPTPDAAGVATTDHALPFQCSGEQHAPHGCRRRVADRKAARARRARIEKPLVLRLGAIDQRVPSHCSTKARALPVVTKSPTA